jgi:TP901 family phage tail tape measure protein
LSAIEIALKFKSDIESLGQIQKDFQTITDKASLKGGPKLNRDFILQNLQEAIDFAIKSVDVGELDASKLGLTKIVSNIQTLMRNIGPEGKQAAAALKPFQDALNEAEEKATELQSQLDKITKKEGAIGPAKLIEAAKGETGFSGKVEHGGSLSEAKKYLKSLEEKDTEDRTPAHEKKIKFYEKLIDLYEQNKTKLKELKDLEKSTQAQKTKADLAVEQASLALKKETKKVEKQLSATQLELLDIIKRLGGAKLNATTIQKELNAAKKEENKQSKQSTKGNNEEAKSLGQKATAAFSYYLVFNQLKRVFNETLRTIQQLDKAMTDAAIVTSMNRKEAWALLGSYQNLARSTGLATSEIANVVTQFLRQGRSVKDAMQLAEVAAKSAKIAGISASEAVNYLTSAVNGFGLAAKDSESIADKFAAIAASSATSFEELAIAMSKVSPTAKSAGVSVDFMMGVIAKGIETTREAPENIGTAFKTIFARMREVTDLGKAMEDGMSLNRVEKALLSVGVPLRDVGGQFRNLEQVLIDVGNKWDTLTSIEQAYLATALAGSRQQPRLLAIFNDFARTKELIQLSAEATGELAFQHVEYMKGSEAALTNLRTSWEQMTMAFVDTDVIIGSIQGLANSLQFLAELASNGIGTFVFWGSIISGVLIAIVALGRKMAIASIFTLANAMVTKFNTNAQAKLKKQLEGGTKAFNKKTKSQQLDTITTILSMLATKGYTGAIKIASKALWAQVKATVAAMVATFKLILVMLPFIVMLLAVAGIIAGLVFLFINLSKTAADFGKEILENNKKINEINKKEKDLKKLVDRFKELEKITAKTAEQFDELNDLGEQLSEQEYGGRTYQLTRQDMTGAFVFNQAEYDAMIAQMKKDRKKLDEENKKIVQDALKKFGFNALEDENILNVLRKIGYEAGLQYIESFGEGMSADLEKQLKEVSLRMSELLDPSKYFATREEARFVGNVSYTTIITEFDEEAFKEAIQKTIDLFKKNIELLQKDLSDLSLITPEGEQRTKAVFLRQALLYKNALSDINEEFADDAEGRRVAIQVLDENFRDNKILYDLIESKKISVDLIVKMSANLNLEQLNAFFNKIDEITDKIKSRINLGISLLARDTIMSAGMDNVTRTDPLTAKEQADITKNVMDAANNAKATITTALEKIFTLDAFVGEGEGAISQFQKGFRDLNTEVDRLTEMGLMTAEEAREIILMASNAIKTMSVEDISKKLKEQVDSLDLVVNLKAQIAKGDFTNIAKIIENYGAGVAASIMRGDVGAMEAYLRAENADMINQINLSIQKIQETRAALGGDLTVAEQNEIDALELMLEYYEDLAVYDGIRLYRLNQAKELLKEMNDLISIQNKLIQLGFGSNITDILSSIIGQRETGAIELLKNQLQLDLAQLEEFRNDETGLFEDADNLGAGEAAITKTLDTLRQLVDAVTASYERQKKEIEERYKTEMDAIKKGHDERWAAIDYANKLLDIEEQVLNARLKLAGLSISGVTKGTLEQARKDLKKIQEEQQKLIEKEAVDRATKELEQQMQNELMVIQTQLRESLDYLGAEIQKYAFVLTETTEITAGSAAETNQNFVRVGNEIARAANVIEDSTTKLNDTNIVLNTSTLELNSSVIKLTRVMLGKEGTKAPVETQDTDQKDYAFVSMERI